MRDCPERILAGGFILALGSAGLALSLPLPFGGLSHMGPGFLPTVISIGLLLCGLFISFTDDNAESAGSPIRARGLLLVLASTMSFAFALERLGLILSIMLSVALAMAAKSPFGLMRLIVLSALR